MILQGKKRTVKFGGAAGRGGRGGQGWAPADLLKITVENCYIFAMGRNPAGNAAFPASDPLWG